MKRLLGSPAEFAASCGIARGMARGSARLPSGGLDGGQLVRAGARGRCWPAARRGRYRAKAERADRQRRESLRAHRARPPGRVARFTPDSGSRQRVRDHLRLQPHGAPRAPLKTLEIFITGSRRRRPTSSGTRRKTADNIPAVFGVWRHDVRVVPYRARYVVHSVRRRGKLLVPTTVRTWSR
jgi:hypothetical protein